MLYILYAVQDSTISFNVSQESEKFEHSWDSLFL